MPHKVSEKAAFLKKCQLYWKKIKAGAMPKPTPAIAADLNACSKLFALLEEANALIGKAKTSGLSGAES